MDESEDAVMLGVRHTHAWERLTARRALQTAHDALRWDVAKSRIIGVEQCTVCGEYHDGSVEDCAVLECADHAICERPYR